MTVRNSSVSEVSYAARYKIVIPVRSRRRRRFAEPLLL